MKRLIRKILKEESLKQENLKQTLKQAVKEFGILETIKMFGDFNFFNAKLPNYFDSNNNKIDLINQLVQDNVSDDDIYFYELINSDISLGQVDSYDNGDGHTFEEYMLSVGDGSVQISVYEYDEDGDMYDEYVDSYRVSLGKLPDNELNKVFKVLVGHYL